MTALFGANATKRDVNVPSEKLDVTEQHGRVRRAYDSYTLSGELSLNDTIDMMKLPTGARIVDARLVAPSDGTTGQYDAGWLDAGSVSADQNGLFAGATEGDSGGGAVDSKLGGASPGYNQKFDGEAQIQLFLIEATTASSGDKIELEVWYLVD